jgi:hypothetical protein
MSFIKNVNMANQALVVGVHQSVGDANGVFDVPDEYAKLLVGTPGWEVSEEGPQELTAVDPVAALRAKQESQASPPAPEPVSREEAEKLADAARKRVEAAKEPAPAAEPAEPGVDLSTPDVGAEKPKKRGGKKKRGG